MEQQADERAVDAHGELTQEEAAQLIERALPLLLAYEGDAEGVVEASPQRDVVHAEHPLGRIGHDRSEALGDEAPGLGPAACSVGPDEAELGVVGIPAPSVEAADQARCLAPPEPAVEAGYVAPLRSRVRPIEDLEHDVPHVEHELAKALTPVRAWDCSLAEDLLDDEAQLGRLRCELLELKEDVPNHPVTAGHEL